MSVWCGIGRLRLYRSVARGNQCRFFLVISGKFVFEEVVTQGESIAVPVKGVEGSRSAFPDSGISIGGWPGRVVRVSWRLCMCVGKPEGLFVSGFRELFFARLM